jgi:hypothetical protein
MKHFAEFFLNWKILHLLPSLRGGVYRAGRAGLESIRMVGMGMGNHNRIRLKVRNSSKPILAAVDHDLSPSMENHR